MGKRSSFTSKTGKRELNPTDAFRKQQRNKEKKRNKKERLKVREEASLRKNPLQIKEDLAKLKQHEILGRLDAKSKVRLEHLEGLWETVKTKLHAEKAAQDARLRGFDDILVDDAVLASDTSDVAGVGVVKFPNRNEDGNLRRTDDSSSEESSQSSPCSSDSEDSESEGEPSWRDNKSAPQRSKNANDDSSTSSTPANVTNKFKTDTIPDNVTSTSAPLPTEWHPPLPAGLPPADVSSLFGAGGMLGSHLFDRTGPMAMMMGLAPPPNRPQQHDPLLHPNPATQRLTTYGMPPPMTTTGDMILPRPHPTHRPPFAPLEANFRFPFRPPHFMPYANLSPYGMNPMQQHFTPGLPRPLMYMPNTLQPQIAPTPHYKDLPNPPLPGGTMGPLSATSGSGEDCDFVSGPAIGSFAQVPATSEATIIGDGVEGCGGSWNGLEQLTTDSGISATSAVTGKEEKSSQASSPKGVTTLFVPTQLRVHAKPTVKKEIRQTNINQVSAYSTGTDRQSRAPQVGILPGTRSIGFSIGGKSLSAGTLGAEDVNGENVKKKKANPTLENIDQVFAAFLMEVEDESITKKYS